MLEIVGVAVAAKAINPAVRVIGVQARGAAAYPPSLAAGAPQKVPAPATIADGIAVLQPGELTFAHVSKLVDEVVTVTDDDLSAALLMLLERHKMLAEPAGAAAVAALLTGAVDPEGAPDFEEYNYYLGEWVAFTRNQLRLVVVGQEHVHFGQRWR